MKQLNYEITHRYEGVNISDAEFDRLISAAVWKTRPVFLRRGRVARHLLEEPATLVSGSSRQLGVAKLKGVGVYDPAALGRYRDKILDSFSDEPQQPTTKPLDSFASYPHVGIGKDGSFCFAYGGVAPVGGILHERALREFNTARILHEHGVPTIIPLVVLRYTDMEFEGKPMGAVITLSSEPEPYRLAQVQYLASVQPEKDPAAYAYYEKVVNTLGIEGDPAEEATRLQATRELARDVGKIVHDFSMAGLYRHSSEWSNFEYCFQHKEVFLTDLDSVREMSELTPELRTLQALRDVGTTVYRLISKFSTPTALGKFTISNLMKYDPLIQLLFGYFPDADKQQLRTIASKLWAAYMPYFCLLNKHKEHITGDWDQERRKSYKMDHDLFYVLSMILLFPIFESSDLGRMYPSDLTQEILLERAGNFLGDRFGYLQFLMGNQLTSDSNEAKTFEMAGGN